MLSWVSTHEIRTVFSRGVTTRDVLSQTYGHLIFDFDQYQSSHLAYYIYRDRCLFGVRSRVLHREMGLRS